MLAGWLRHRPDLDLVLLVLGDHQPLAAVSGEGAPWEVPVHLITGRAEVRDAFLAQGFVPGLVPRRPALGGMADLTQMLAAGLRLRLTPPGYTIGRDGTPFHSRRARWALPGLKYPA